MMLSDEQIKQQADQLLRMADDPNAKAQAEKLSSMVEQMSPEQRTVWNKLVPGDYVPTVAECALLKPLISTNKDMLKGIIAASMPGVRQAVGEDKMDQFFEAIRTADPSLLHSILSFSMGAKKMYAGMQARFGKWTNTVIVLILAVAILIFLWLSYRVLAWIFGMVFGYGGGASAPAEGAAASEPVAEEGGFFGEDGDDFGDEFGDFDDGEM